MIHPDYSLQLLDILLKTKPDDKYTSGSEEDQNTVMQLPFVTKADDRTVIYSSYSYDSTSFVPIDNEIKKYSDASETELDAGSFSYNQEGAAHSQAYNKVVEKRNELMNKNVYNINNFSTTEHRITVPITRIDPNGPKVNKKLFYPVGARVLNFTFDDENPELVEPKEKDLYEISLSILYSLAPKNGDKKPELDKDIETKINEIKTNFAKELTAIQTYASAKPQNYYTEKDEEQNPISEEKVNVTLHCYKIVSKSATIYCKYVVSGKEENASTTFTYYALEETEETFEINSWLFSQAFGANDQGAIYPKRAFIGLFTQMPDAYGKNFVEPTWKTNDNLHTYQRMSLHEDLLYGGMSLNNVRQIGADSEQYPNDVTEHGKDYLGYAFVDNKEIVLFPEILDETGWGKIVGFGLFENEEPIDGETPYFWGEITDKDGVVISVPTEKWKVPLFRKNEFKVYLG